MSCHSKYRSMRGLLTLGLLALLSLAGSPSFAQGGGPPRLLSVTFDIPNSFGLGGPGPMRP